MIMRNTTATHLPSDVFSTPGLILEVTRHSNATTSMVMEFSRAPIPSARAFSRRWSSGTIRPRRVWTPIICGTPATNTSCSGVPSRPTPSLPASVTTRCSATAATTG